jgi:hypothetical protein
MVCGPVRVLQPSKSKVLEEQETRAERPLRLSFSAMLEHLAAFDASKAFEALATSRKSGIKSASLWQDLSSRLE